MSTTCPRPIAWKSCALSNVGAVREVNEDAVIEVHDAQLWAVADGMGGHQVGDVASQKIIGALEYFDSEQRMSVFVDDFEDRLISVNEQLVEYAEVMLEEGTIGSTVVALMIRDRLGVCAWVGDSRLYRYRNKMLTQLSRDHSQVQEMLSMGMLSEEEAVDYPHGNVITRAVGAEAELFVDLNAFSIYLGDVFLLCSDGLYNVVSDEEIAGILAERDVELAAQRLIDKALEYGAPDNVSVIVVRGEAGRFPAQAGQANTQKEPGDFIEREG